MTLYVVIGLLVVLPFIFGFFIKQNLKSSKAAWLLGFFMAVICVAVYVFTLYNPQRINWYDQREKLIPEVQAFLESNSASKTLKQLDGAHFVSMLQYYAQQYPQDSRVWQKLAVVMVNLNMPEEGLQAIRRYLALEPDQLEALQLEIQLLGELVDQGEIAPRQLWFALDHMAVKSDLLPQDAFYLAGVARQHDFFDLAITFWQKVLQSDKRSDNELSSKALQGRMLLQRMIGEAQQQQAQNGNKAFLMNDKESRKSGKNIATMTPIPEIALQIELKPEIIHKLKEYFKTNERAHLWVSIKPAQEGMPPYAAKLIWIHKQDFLAGMLELNVKLGQEDLIRPQQGWQKDEAVRLTASVYLSDVQSDPMAKNNSDFRIERSLNVKNSLKL